MSNFNQKSPDSLTNICQNFIIKYTHQVVWRQLDPPKSNCHECFKPTDFQMICSLPFPAQNQERDPKVFRKRFSDLKHYFSTNLVRPVYEALSLACRKFVSQNRLKYGDVILSLVFQDCFSQVLEMRAKHLVFRKWSLREEMSLKRVLMQGKTLVKLSLPGKADEKLLILISKYCQQLEDLDISTSYVTDKGLLALCGVEVEQVDDEPTEELNESVEKVDDISFEKPSRAAAVRARARLDQIKTDPSFLRKLAIGSSSSGSGLEDMFSLLSSKMKPYVDKKQDPSLQARWSSKPGYWSTFTKNGCKKLVKLDLTRTNYPKRSLDKKGDMILTLGLTRDSVLAALILLENLKILKYYDLGELLQLYEMVMHETCKSSPQLKLMFLMDSSLTMDKLEVANRVCPRITKMDISMFNFSFAEMDFQIGPTYGQSSSPPEEENLGKSNTLIFSFSELRDLEVQYMDDSPAFHNAIQNCSSKMTRICLNKMISISFETLAAVKNFCNNLETFEVFVDNLHTLDTSNTLEQVIAETPNSEWESLKSLKLGGLIPCGSVIPYLVAGCSQLRVLCLNPYESQAELITDQLVQQMLVLNPCKTLVSFYFEKCLLSEQTFFLLLSSLPQLKHVGVLSDWFGMDRRARLSIKAFVRGNNVDVDIDSAHVHDF